MQCNMVWSWFGLWCLMPLLTIVQLHLYIVAVSFLVEQTYLFMN